MGVGKLAYSQSGPDYMSGAGIGAGIGEVWYDMVRGKGARGEGEGEGDVLRLGWRMGCWDDEVGAVGDLE